MSGLQEIQAQAAAAWYHVRPSALRRLLYAAAQRLHGRDSMRQHVLEAYLAEAEPKAWAAYKALEGCGKLQSLVASGEPYLQWQEIPGTGAGAVKLDAAALMLQHMLNGDAPEGEPEDDDSDGDEEQEQQVDAEQQDQEASALGGSKCSSSPAIEPSCPAHEDSSEPTGSELTGAHGQVVSTAQAPLLRPIPARWADDEDSSISTPSCAHQASDTRPSSSPALASSEHDAVEEHVQANVHAHISRVPSSHAISIPGSPSGSQPTSEHSRPHTWPDAAAAPGEGPSPSSVFAQPSASSDTASRAPSVAASVRSELHLGGSMSSSTRREEPRSLRKERADGSSTSSATNAPQLPRPSARLVGAAAPSGSSSGGTGVFLGAPAAASGHLARSASHASSAAVSTASAAHNAQARAAVPTEDLATETRWWKKKEAVAAAVGIVAAGAPPGLARRQQREQQLPSNLLPRQGQPAPPIRPPPPARTPPPPPTSATGSDRHAAIPAPHADGAAGLECVQSRLSPACIGLRILALAAYRTPPCAAAASQACDGLHVPYHFTQLRCLAACALAAAENGPAGPHSLGVAALSAKLSQADPGAWAALMTGCAASGAATFEEAGVWALADGVGLHAVCAPDGTTALQLDIQGLEKAATGLASFVLPVDGGQLAEAFKSSTHAANGAVGMALPHTAVASAPGHAPTARSSSELPSAAQPLAPEDQHALVAACLSVWWPHHPALAAAAISILLQPPQVIERNGRNTATLSHVTKQMVLVCEGVGEPVGGSEDSESARALLAEGAPILKVCKAASGSVVQLDVAKLCSQAAEAQARGSSAQAGAHQSAQWPPSFDALLRLAIGCHPAARPQLHALHAKVTASNGPAVVDSYWLAILRLAAGHCDAHGSRLSSSGPCPAARGAAANSPQAPSPSNVSSADLQAAVAVVYAGSEPQAVLRRLAAQAAAKRADGECGPYSIKASDLAQLFVRNAPEQWAAQQKAEGSKMKALFGDGDGIMARVSWTQQSLDPAKQQPNYSVQLDPAVLLQAAAQARGPTPSTGGRPQHNHQQRSFQVQPAANEHRQWTTAQLDSAESDMTFSTESLQAAAAVAYAGSEPQAVLRRLAAQAAAEHPDGPVGPYSITGPDLGSRLKQQAGDAWEAQPKKGRMQAVFGEGDGILSLVPWDTNNFAVQLDVPELLLAAAAAGQ